MSSSGGLSTSLTVAIRKYTFTTNPFAVESNDVCWRVLLGKSTSLLQPNQRQGVVIVYKAVVNHTAQLRIYRPAAHDQTTLQITVRRGPRPHPS